jgi:hypothetical protein
MSYGKNDSHLTRIGGYGASSSQQMGNATRRQQGPRKGSPSWANNYQPSEGSADYIRLLAGNYQAQRVNSDTGQEYVEDVPWFECAEHYHGGNKRSTICSAGIHYMDQKKAQRCRGCDIWHEDMKARRAIEDQTGRKPQTPNRISRSSKYVFLVLDMCWYFKGYQLDEHGRVVVNQNSNKPFEQWMKFNQDFHDEYNYAMWAAQQQNKQLEWRNGMVKTWPVGFTQFGVLSGYADVIQNHCKSCGGQNCIRMNGWVCPNCSAPTLTTSLSHEDVKKLVSQAIFCNHCKTMAYPRAVQSCMNCPNPAQANLYDIDLQVQQTRVNKNKQLIIPWMSAPRPMDPQYAEALKKMPDVQQKFAPTAYEEQIAKFGQPSYDNTQQGAPQQQGWGQPQQGWGQPQQQWQPQQLTWGGQPQTHWQAPQPQQWQPQQQPQQWPQPAPQWGGGWQNQPIPADEIHF